MSTNSIPDLMCGETLDSVLDVFEYDELPGQRTQTQEFRMVDGFKTTIKGHHKSDSLMYNTPDYVSASASSSVDTNDGPAFFDNINRLRHKASTPKKQVCL